MDPMDTPLDYFIRHISNVSLSARNMQLEDISQGEIRNRIIILSDNEPVISPCINGIDIIFPKTFLYLLYSVCYFCFVYTERIMELESNGIYDGTVNETPLTKRALNLVNYALNLRHKYIDWPIDLLDPSNDEVYTKDTNVIFAYSLAYIYFHEYAHVKMKHRNDVDQIIRIQQENEADNFALDIILGPLEDDRIKRDYGIGVACAGITMLFGLKDGNSLVQQAHPDVDIRLSNSMEYLKIEGKKENYYLYKLLTVGLMSFCDIYKIEVPRQIYDTIEDHYNDLLGIIERYKSSR